MDLIIVESPSKANTISKFLGKNYKVISSLGHIMDLPKTKLGVDLENKYKPLYEIIKGKEDVVKKIQKDAELAKLIILATDPDREGEAISWHIFNLISKLNSNIKRIVFHEITKEAIYEALNSPRDIDINLVDAQQARRVLDRLVGYTLSPLLWKKIKYGLSAGRVQSVALRLIIDREREIRSFVSKEYWKLFLTVDENQTDCSINLLYKADNDNSDNTFTSNPGEDVFFELKSLNSKKPNFENKDVCLDLANKIANKDLIVKKVSKKELISKAPPPLITSTFQQACINTLGISAKKAMSIAQKLYENGLITYMRTDSYHLSEKAISSARMFIENNFGKEYLPNSPNIFKIKSKNAQEAHEAIRPTDFNLTDLGSDYNELERRVYKLIFNSAIACQMAPARFLLYSIYIESQINEDILLFNSSYKKCEFDGWMKLYPKSLSTNSMKESSFAKLLENFWEGKVLYPKIIIAKQKFTEPPSRYTEATLIKALDKFGIGRPSTYATILNIIVQRDYVVKKSGVLYPTEIGEVVINFLGDHFGEIVDIDFTARMEDDLDKIALGKLDYFSFVDIFFSNFNKKIKLKENEIDKQKYTTLGVSDSICDICGSPMIKKIGKYGIFLSCKNYPICKGIKKFNSEIEQIDLSIYKEPPLTSDGKTFVLKKGRFGYFWAHPDYPKVKELVPLELKTEFVNEIFGDPPVASDGVKMVLKKGRFGYFWAHPNYPQNKEIRKAKKLIKNDYVII